MRSFRKGKFPLLLLALILLTSCDYRDVEVTEVRSIQINSLTKNGIDLTGQVKVYNPNGYKIKIKSTDADLYLDGRKAGKTKLIDKVIVPANFNDYLTVKVRADFDDGRMGILPIILGAAVKRGVDIRVEGSLTAGTFIFNRKFPFNYEHEARF